ncbi:MAG: hypothetical protein DMG41_09840 [Acidobacteria bacterium]|nr:MAG: hypothetical protein AUH13_31315 [Acidobacteria bacterium 13_2_20CM_58_27]PYT75808.1 MAG: hypothetical protein DMG42_07140 [Acidobacteriota bacterium]PYT88887.1 MAG: hypothetical protein DMG41_09840 [Acidobacteriota bacterium]
MNFAQSERFSAPLERDAAFFYRRSFAITDPAPGQVVGKRCLSLELPPPVRKQKLAKNSH